MTNTEINIAIAEACGWKKTIEMRSVVVGYDAEIPVEFWHSPDGRSACREWYPDYCHDLNAMREAEEQLPCAFCGEFEGELNRLAIESWQLGTGRGGLWPTWHATARQRAEAFLRTKGLWND
jgi:hypothetical protein